MSIKGQYLFVLICFVVGVFGQQNSDSKVSLLSLLVC